MNKSIGDMELEELLQAARTAGDAEGYARAKFEMALEKAKGTLVAASGAHEIVSNAPPQTKVEKSEELRNEAKRTEKTEEYKTRMTVSMTKTIALDYLKSVAPRIVGPSEIKKNSEKNLDIFLSYGTLQRAMAQLIQSGEVELIEKSRWKYKSGALRSVK